MGAWRSTRYLIVNADDFGQSAGVNRGVMEAHERGILTSASLMVRWDAAPDAAAYARAHRGLSVGIHFDFAEWICRRGEWTRLYEVVPLDDPHAVAEEAARQLAAFRRLMDAEPTHIDSHQHAHRARGVRTVLEEMAARLGVPLRACTPRIRYYGGFYGQTNDGRYLPHFVSPRALLATLSTLPPGVTELGCHPAKTGDMHSMYRLPRMRELKTLCDPAVRSAISERRIQLCSFRDFRAREAHA